MNSTLGSSAFLRVYAYFGLLADYPGCASFNLSIPIFFAILFFFSIHFRTIFLWLLLLLFSYKTIPIPSSFGLILFNKPNILSNLDDSFWLYKDLYSLH